MASQWMKEVNFAVTVCDESAQILEMNDKAAKTFERFGGKALIGKSLYDCHNPNSQKKISELLASGRSNTYTIAKSGVKKLIHQTPWHRDGLLAGLVEISIEIPLEMPHFQRD